jgi:hypothetical protein
LPALTGGLIVKPQASRGKKYTLWQLFLLTIPYLCQPFQEEMEKYCSKNPIFFRCQQKGQQLSTDISTPVQMFGVESNVGEVQSLCLVWFVFFFKPSLPKYALQVELTSSHLLSLNCNYMPALMGELLRFDLTY